MILEVVFPVAGESLPTDHAYPLYGALSMIVPAFHAPDSQVRFAPISGIGQAEGSIGLGTHSCLRVRLPDDQIKLVLPLAGKRLVIGASTIRLGVPAVRTLIPAPSLIARIVTFKNADTPEQFLSTAREKLTEMGVTAEPQLPIHLEGSRAGEPKRRIVRIKGVSIVGYSLLVSELSADHSIRLQQVGLGGRTQIGCGYFVPAKQQG